MTPGEIRIDAKQMPPEVLKVLDDWLSVSIVMTRILHESVRSQERRDQSVTSVIESLQVQLGTLDDDLRILRMGQVGSTASINPAQTPGAPVAERLSPANRSVGDERRRTVADGGLHIDGTVAGAAPEQGSGPVGPMPSGPGAPLPLSTEAEPPNAIVGGIELVVGSFSRFSQLGDFLRALRALPGVDSVMTRQFHRGVLRLRVRYDNSIALTARLMDLPAFAPRIVSAAATHIELHVECSSEAEPSLAGAAARASA